MCVWGIVNGAYCTLVMRTSHFILTEIPYVSVYWLLLTGVFEFMMTVSDMNTATPKFELSTYSVDVIETLPAGVIVPGLVVNASGNWRLVRNRQTLFVRIVFVSRWVLPYLNLCVAAIIRADWSPDTLYADTPFMAPFPALVSLDLKLSGIYSYRLVLSGFSMNRTEGSTPCIGDYFSQYARTKYLYTSVFNFLLQMQMLIRRTMNCRLRCKKAVRLVWQRLRRPLMRCRPTTPNWCWTNLWTTIPRRPTNWLLPQRYRPDVTV